MIVDYHMHLRDPEERIDHTREAVERFVGVAAERAVDEIGFAEHVYYFEQTRPLWAVPYQLERCRYDIQAYVDAVADAKRSGLPVKLGLEVDYVPEREEDTRRLLAPYPWDFLLGSVHWLDGHAVDQEPGVWSDSTVEDVWERYFTTLARAAASGLFDVLSHPDLVKIFGRRPAADTVERHHAETADAITEAGVAVEVSTAGLRKPVGELYPDAGFLRACRERGIPITTASDAHVPRYVGESFDEALAHARSAGYETVTVLEGRAARQEALG